jgi:Sigma-70 region 2
MNDHLPQPIPEMLQHWKQLLGLREMLKEPDAILLQRFCAEKNETAFAALMSRHGPMVKGVCRRILRSDEDIEDVLQATFLALARYAPSLRPGSGVAGWQPRHRPLPTIPPVRIRGAKAQPGNTGRAPGDHGGNLLPAKYRSPWQSGLSVEVSGNEMIHDLTLTD